MTTTVITRRVLTALVVGAATVSLAACSPSAPTAATSSAPAAAGTTFDAATAALVSTPAKADQNQGKKQRNARNRLVRALHATWVTKGNQDAAVTHQAIRGEVTAVSARSITVKAADGFSQTYTVSADTKVLMRDLAAVDSTGRKARASSVSDLKVGARALVVGVGATTPAAKRVLFLNGVRPAKTAKTQMRPQPQTSQKPAATNPAPSVTKPASTTAG